ncbi:MAG: polysaccharide deacetylase family protein [Xanthomonadales bacterium]|nr:polysaccharide deacetylase family protein [Xanthomonadales bacterium]
MSEPNGHCPAAAAAVAESQASAAGSTGAAQACAQDSGNGGPAAALSVPAAVSASLRPLALSLLGVGHVLALALLLAGQLSFALAALISSHALVIWGTLYPHSRLFGPVLRRLPTTAPVVWLTIDDGPSDDTAALLDLLDAHQARATFFLVAARAAARADLVAQIVRRGHQIGNHTASHPAAAFWLPWPATTRRQILHAQQVLSSLAGSPPRWFRAVAGHANPFVQPVLAKLDLPRVSWSGRGFDAVDGNDQRVLRRLRRAIAPGAILLLHEGGESGRAARLLAALLAELDQGGYGTVLPEPALAAMPAPMPAPSPVLPALADIPGLAARALEPALKPALEPAPPNPPSAAPAASLNPAAPCPDSGSRPDRTPA